MTDTSTTGQKRRPNTPADDRLIEASKVSGAERDKLRADAEESAGRRQQEVAALEADAAHKQEIADRAVAEAATASAAAAEAAMRLTPEEAAVLAEKRRRAQEHSFDSDAVLDDPHRFGLTPEEAADSKDYLVTEAFTLTLDNHHQVSFRPGVHRIPAKIASHWYCQIEPLPGLGPRVKPV